MADLASLALWLVGLGFLLRFLLEFHRANFYNPVAQVLVRFTDPPTRALGRVVPRMGEWNLPLLLILLMLEALSLWLRGAGGFGPALGVLASFQIASRAMDIYLVCLIVTVIASWIQFTGQAQPVLNLAQALASPMLRRVRSVLPSAGMLDFSPMVAVFGLLFAQWALAQASAWILIRL